ncbi:winged helix-turn-helix domain-containing protein [Paenibacillus sp. JCM 10914]|uniref:winged helix-turn-helix domain-containing protein n=1 Tax=Paenibacillus sp. JCM 10914 TaxID=1236974 RepID=UPI0003CCA8DF|nr:winged helix-turn-helix domain-containing protein [Paenibacillus sp. JCM 10914]GAE07385.1 hypothetical protein JCM10914_3612 [Paenibacillus sp. JCM 10914]
MNSKEPMFEISVEQAKLLGSAQRVKIIGTIIETAKTSKQVADELGDSPGSVHYHIQKLYEGGLIELVDTKPVGGIVEKYYKSKSKWFTTRGEQQIDPVLADNFESDFKNQTSLRMQLSDQERDDMAVEFRDLLEKWVMKSIASKSKGKKEYAVGLNIVSTEAAEKK